MKLTPEAQEDRGSSTKIGSERRHCWWPAVYEAQVRVFTHHRATEQACFSCKRGCVEDRQADKLRKEKVRRLFSTFSVSMSDRDVGRVQHNSAFEYERYGNGISRRESNIPRSRRGTWANFQIVLTLMLEVLLPGLPRKSAHSAINADIVMVKHSTHARIYKYLGKKRTSSPYFENKIQRGEL